MNAPQGYGFDDSGQLVAVVQPPEDQGDVCPCCDRPYGDAGPTCAERRRIREEAMRDVLLWLASDNDVRRVGWTAVLAHWILVRGETQEELAARMGVTGGRLSQKLKQFRVQKALIPLSETEVVQTPD